MRTSVSACIGLIGAGGLVGRHLTLRLLEYTDATLRLGGRRPEAHTELVAGAGTRAHSHAVDLEDARSLAAFVRGCDLLINASGPSTLFGEVVARTALEADVDYLDPGGYDPLLAAFARMHEQVVRQGRRFVANAGLLPGLSGVLPMALTRSVAGCHKLNVAYIGTDQWSYASAYDIVASLGDFGAERPFSAIRYGSAERRPWWRASRRFSASVPIGDVRAWLFYTEELARLARTESIIEVLAYGVNHGPASAKVLAATKLLKRYRTQAGREKAARALVEAATRDAVKHPACFAILAEAQGAGDSSPVHKAELLIRDTYRGTAEVTALAAQAMLEQRMPPGTYSLHEAVEPDWLLKRFMASGVDADLEWSHFTATNKAMA